MAIIDLCNTTLQVLGPTNAKDVYGSSTVSFTPVYINVPGRVIYTGGLETVSNGKEMVTPTHRIFVASVLDLDETYMIIDDSTGSRYDILQVNVLGEFSNYHHLELDCKLVDDIGI